MIITAHPVTFRRYRAMDYSSVSSLWTRINQELAPVGMEKLFEQYIAMTIEVNVQLDYIGHGSPGRFDRDPEVLEDLLDLRFETAFAD
jgi:hypothetical protein